MPYSHAVVYTKIHGPRSLLAGLVSPFQYIPTVDLRSAVSMAECIDRGNDVSDVTVIQIDGWRVDYPAHPDGSFGHRVFKDHGDAIRFASQYLATAQMRPVGLVHPVF